jgi:hypothetical protein
MIERGSRSHIDLKRDTIMTVMLRLPDLDVPDRAAARSVGLQQM